MTISRREMTLLFIMALVAVFLGTGIARADEQTAKKKYPIPGHGVLELNVPASWKAKIHTPQENMPSTIIFSPPTGNDFQVTMMVLLGKKEEPNFNGPEKVKTLLEKEGQKLLPRIVETKIDLHEIKGGDRTG